MLRLSDNGVKKYEELIQGSFDVAAIFLQRAIAKDVCLNPFDLSIYLHNPFILPGSNCKRTLLLLVAVSSGRSE